MTNEPYVIGGAMKDPVLQAIDIAKWCDDAVLDPTIKTPTMTYLQGANKQIEAIRSAYIAERQRLEQRIAELEAVLTGIANANMNEWEVCEGMTRHERDAEFREWAQSIARHVIKTQG